MRCAPAPAADVRAGRGQRSAPSVASTPGQRDTRSRRRRSTRPPSEPCAASSSRPGRSAATSVPGPPLRMCSRSPVVGLPASLPMKMPWQAVPGSLERDRQRRRVGVRRRRLAVRDLDRALARLPTPHSERRVVRVRGDDVDRLGGRDRLRRRPGRGRSRRCAPCPRSGSARRAAGWRGWPGSPPGAGRARLRRGSSRAQRRRRWTRCCRGSVHRPVTALCGTATRAHSLRAVAPAGGTTSTVSSNRVAAARAEPGQPEQGQGAGGEPEPGQHRTTRLVGPRRVPATLVELYAARIRSSRRLPDGEATRGG